MNLLKLYTRHGAIYVDGDQLEGSRNLLTIYTRNGNRKSETARTQEERERASFGVHRDNLYASKALADAATDRIFAAMRERSSGVQA